RIICNLRPCRRDARNQRGLADVGVAHQAHVGEQLELQAQNSFLARLTRLMLARRLVRAGSKMLIATTATSAVGYDNALVSLRKIVDLLTALVVIHDGSDRHLQDHTFAITAGAIGTFAVASTLGVVFRIEAEMDQRVVAFAGFHAPVAATPAVAARRAAAGNELLAAKSHATIAAVA